MAEGFFKSFDPTLEVFSAGTFPATGVQPKAVQVMKEIGIDLKGAYPKGVQKFLKLEFDYVITVCDDANESCPVFSGKVKHRLHMGFDDPSFTSGSDEHVLEEFRRVRDEMGVAFKEFYQSIRNET
jgi:arsenate reductase